MVDNVINVYSSSDNIKEKADSAIEGNIVNELNVSYEKKVKSRVDALPIDEKCTNVVDNDGLKIPSIKENVKKKAESAIVEIFANELNERSQKRECSCRCIAN